MNEEVECRPIAGFDGYRVGNDGSIWSLWQLHGLGRGKGTAAVMGEEWRRLRPSTEKRTGYQVVRLCRRNHQTTRRVHGLVLTAFVGPRPGGTMCCHRDDDPRNNAAINLRWDVAQGNSDDAIRNGRVRRGANASKAKLTEIDVREIRRRYAANELDRSIAGDFGVTAPHVRAIAKGRFWGSLSTEHDAACKARDLRNPNLNARRKKDSVTLGNVFIPIPAPPRG